WLARATGEPEYAEYYSDFWHDITTYFADHRSGSWWHELDVRNRPATATWDGKPDLYHAFQATLAARLTRPQGFAAAARTGAIDNGQT
ncbi:AGE family epimerase/isomerase, partial [Microbacterium sp.]|uniref:AGE family epimerase/isomerase n=1 Tax=Microbacterium sp. TaxID=51671 RepID=UPI002635657A